MQTYFYIRTLDGYDTFHSMGGAMCVMPSTGVKPWAESALVLQHDWQQ